MKITTELADAIAALYKAELDGGFLYIFSGPIPASAEDALTVGPGGDHTQLAMLSESDDGVTGLTWSAPVDGVIVKNPSETWEGLNDFDGAEELETTLTATFARFCPSGDNGRTAAVTPRVQFCITGPAGGCELLLNSTSVTANGVLKTRIDFARIVQSLG